MAVCHPIRHAGELRLDPDRMILAGDSAGAQIAAQVALITTDPAYAAWVGIAPTLSPDQLCALLLLSGAYDLDAADYDGDQGWFLRSEEHTSELQSRMRLSYAVFCWKKKQQTSSLLNLSTNFPTHN